MKALQDFVNACVGNIAAAISQEYGIGDCVDELVEFSCMKPEDAAESGIFERALHSARVFNLGRYPDDEPRIEAAPSISIDHNICGGGKNFSFSERLSFDRNGAVISGDVDMPVSRREAYSFSMDMPPMAAEMAAEKFGCILDECLDDAFRQKP